jgi:hypothetical protein
MKKRHIKEIHRERERDRMISASCFWVVECGSEFLINESKYLTFGRYILI